MILWSWQNKVMSIIDPAQKVKPLKYTRYRNHKNILKAYEKLWRILKTDQFHWFSTTQEDYKILRPAKHHKEELLWEINVQNEDISFTI